MEELKQDVQRGKITRTVRLNLDVDAKLVKLTELLGTTINAYLNVKMGEVINRDYLAYQMADRQSSQLEAFMQTALVAMKEQMEKE